MVDTVYTVLIPAHDEEQTIARTLAAMGDAADFPQRRMIVVCNACNDRTAQAAQAAAPDALVINQAEGGKWRALNMGLDHADAGSVLIVDADVEISGMALEALAAQLSHPYIHAASPAVQFDLENTNPWVRAYYRVFARHSYLRRGVGGAGVYGLSAAGRAALGPFPALMSDDGYVRRRISSKKQRRVKFDAEGCKVRAKVRPPRNAIELIRTEARWRRGDKELRSFAPKRGGQRHVLWSLLKSGKIDWIDASRYLLIKLGGRALAALKPVHPDKIWRKDVTSRQ